MGHVWPVGHRFDSCFTGITLWWGNDSCTYFLLSWGWLFYINSSEGGVAVTVAGTAVSPSGWGRWSQLYPHPHHFSCCQDGASSHGEQLCCVLLRALLSCSVSPTACLRCYVSISLPPSINVTVIIITLSSRELVIFTHTQTPLLPSSSLPPLRGGSQTLIHTVSASCDVRLQSTSRNLIDRIIAKINLPPALGRQCYA